MIIYKGGSGVNPYINNPKDKDYIVFLQDNEYDSFEQTTYKDGHLMKRKLSNYGDIVEIWTYLWHFMQPVEGEPIQLPNFFDKKEQWFAKAKKLLYHNGKRKVIFNIDKKTRKVYYHILMGLYIFQNNSYELTMEQEYNVQLAHDGILPSEVVEWIYNQVG